MFRSRSLLWTVVAAALLLSACRDAKSLTARGDGFMAAKKYREATIEYRNALKKEPRLGEVRIKLADAYEALGDYDNAVREAQRGADLLADDSAVQLKTGQLLLTMGRFDEAKARATKILGKNPKNVDALVLLANSMAGLKEFDNAIKELEGAIELDPRRSLSYANLGGMLLRSGNRDDAERRFRSAIALDPKSVTAHVALANFLWTTDRQAEAEAALKDALALEPGNILVRRALAAIYTTSGRSAEAEPHLKAAADASKSPGLRVVLADYYISEKRTDDALRVLREVSKMPDGFGIAETRIAAVLYESGKKAEAHKTIDAVLAKLPTDPPALMTKGRFLMGDDKRDEALEKVRAAIAVDPRYAPAQYLLGLLSLPADPSSAIKAFNEVVKYSPRAVEAYLQLAQLHLSQGETAAAVDRAGEAVRYDPKNFVSHSLFARALLANGEIDRAAQEAQFLEASAPTRPEGPILAALVAVARKDLVGATKLFEKALLEDPDSIEALQGVVQLDLASNRKEKAKARVAAALSRDGKNSRLHLLSAGVASALGDAPGVERSLRMAAEADPSALDAYLGLGRLYASQNKLAEAQKEFEVIAAQQPKSIGAHTFVAMAMQVQGHTAEAEKRYQQILTIDPLAPIAANNLAAIWVEQNRNLDAALQLAQTAKSRMPERPEINDTLGWIYYKKGLAAMAVGPLLQAADKAPKNATIQFHAGLALARAGNKPEARKHLEAALALAPTFAGADEARQTLASLK
jgi:putative PEP-CTERM system TPR-repeat lipoprotein